MIYAFILYEKNTHEDRNIKNKVSKILYSENHFQCLKNIECLIYSSLTYYIISEFIKAFTRKFYLGIWDIHFFFAKWNDINLTI